MSDLGELNYCLGVQFQRDRKTHTITMSQTSYIEEVLRRFNMEDCKPVATPSDANFKLLKLLDEEFGNVKMEMEGVPYIQHNFIREKLESEEICLSYCPTEHMIADVLTKALAKDRHHSLSRAMDLEIFDNSQSGSVEGKALNEEIKP